MLYVPASGALLRFVMLLLFVLFVLFLLFVLIPCSGGGGGLRGMFGGMMLGVITTRRLIFRLYGTLRGETRRLISARPATCAERRQYEEAR